MTGFDLAVLVVAARGALHDDAVLASVQGFHRVAAVGSQQIALCVDGYDEDPRELWQVPEVARFLRRWAFATGLCDWRHPRFRLLNDASIALLALCEALSPGHPFTALAEDQGSSEVMPRRLCLGESCGEETESVACR